MKTFAIVLVCYNRIHGLKRLLRSLERVDYNGRKDIDLIFSIDNSGNDTVLNYASEYHWSYGNKSIRTFDKRLGLRDHILKCGDYTKEYDIVTILEDDIYVSDSFYNYAYKAAEFYYDDDNIAGISLYNFQKNWLSWVHRFEPHRDDNDVYFMKKAQSWGQVWTYDKWSKFKQWYNDNKIFIKSDSIPVDLNRWPESSWLKYHDRYCIENNKYFVYPYVSLSTNFSDIGEHATFNTNDHQVELQTKKVNFKFSSFDNNAITYDEYMNRQGLGKYLGIDEDLLCVDLWGTKHKSLFKRYVLSLENLDYKIIKSFALALRPIELSVIDNLEGDDIRLYDTSERIKNKNKSKRSYKYKLFLYSIRSHDGIYIYKHATLLFLMEVKRKLTRLYNKLFQK